MKLSLGILILAAAVFGTARSAVTGTPISGPCPEVDPTLQADVRSFVDAAVEDSQGGLLQYADPSTLRPVTKRKDCKALNELVDPSYGISADPPAFFVNYFQVDATEPASGPVKLTIAVLARNSEVSTIDGPGYYLVYEPGPRNTFRLIETFLDS